MFFQKMNELRSMPAGMREIRWQNENPAAIVRRMNAAVLSLFRKKRRRQLDEDNVQLWGRAVQIARRNPLNSAEQSRSLHWCVIFAWQFARKAKMRRREIEPAPHRIRAPEPRKRSESISTVGK